MATEAPAAPFSTGPFSSGSSQPFEEPARDQRFDNQPPLEERVMLEFEEDLDRLGINRRIEELLASAAKCPAVIQDEITCGKIGDFVRLAREVEKKIDDAREKHNRPLIDARTKLKSKADSLYGPLGDAVTKMRGLLNAFTAKQAEEAAAERRRIEDEQRKAREAMQAAGVDEKVMETVTAPPPPAKAPIVRGNYGSSVSGREVFKHERQVPVSKLPKAILENAQVVEAVDKVIAAMIRTGTREIKGVRIYSVTEATVR